MTKHEELRKWIRENLVIDIEPLNQYGSSHDVKINLKLRGEERPFTSDYINIPDTE